MYFLLFAVKGYLRKGNILTSMKEYSKAQDVYQKALEIDPNCRVSLNSGQNIKKKCLRLLRKM